MEKKTSDFLVKLHSRVGRIIAFINIITWIIASGTLWCAYLSVTFSRRRRGKAYNFGLLLMNWLLAEREICRVVIID